MMQTLYLSFTLPDGEHKKIELKPDSSESILIGRNRASHIKLNLPSVSRQHAKIFFESGNYWIEDLGSSNGTFVNREQVHHVRISPGDLLQCGEFEIEVMSHAETSIYGADTPRPSAPEVEVLSEPLIPEPTSPALEPRPRPQASKLSLPPPRAASPFSSPTQSSGRSTVHSKAPTNQPQAHSGLAVSTRQLESHEAGELTSELSALQGRSTELEAQLQERAEELSNMRAQVDAQRALVDKLKGEVSALTSERDQAQSGAEDAQSERDALSRELEVLRASQAGGDSALTQLNEELSASQEERASLNEQLRLLGAELKKNQEALAAAQSDSSREELSEARAQIEELTNARDSAARESSTLQSQLTQAQREASEAQARSTETIKSVRAERDQLSASQEALQSQLASARDELESLRAQLAERGEAASVEVVSSITPADWAAHLARFDQLSHELKALRRVVKGQGGARVNTRPPQATSPDLGEQRPSVPPRDQPREWRGLV